MNAVCIQKVLLWGEEDVKLFIFPRNGCLSSFLVLDVGRKPFELRFFEKRDVP